MSSQIKALIIVMSLTIISFAIAKSVMMNFMEERDFKLRRNTWLALNVAAFVIPEFWSFTLVAGGIMVFAARRDSNPVALYVFLLMALPPVSLLLPGFGLVNVLITVNHLRMLCILILLPLAIKIVRGQLETESSTMPKSKYKAIADICLLCYLALQLLLTAPYVSITATLRQLAELFLFTLLPYFVVSRLATSKTKIVEILAVFVLAAVVLVPLAIFEFLKGWMLFAGLEQQWGGIHMFSYLMRNGYLRAQVTSGHSIALGFLMALAFGMWLYLQRSVPARGWRMLGILALLTALAVSFARGPWVGALAILVVYLVSGPDVVRRLAGAVAVSTAVVGILLLTPYASTAIDYLPFIGSADEGSIDYRQKVAVMSWELIKMNPYFGNPFYLDYMESLRQGEGIIDIVNSYAAISLSYGLVGTALFSAVFVSACLGCWTWLRKLASIDQDMSLLGGALLACLVGCLLMIATVSQILAIPFVQFALAGLGIAYVDVARRRFQQDALSPINANVSANRYSAAVA